MGPEANDDFGAILRVGAVLAAIGVVATVLGGIWLVGHVTIGWR